MGNLTRAATYNSRSVSDEWNNVSRRDAAQLTWEYVSPAFPASSTFVKEEIMTYQEMLDQLTEMTDGERAKVMAEHWQTIFSPGFIAFVQGQLEGGRQLMLDGRLDKVLSGQDEAVAAAIKQSVVKTHAKHAALWLQMRDIYAKLQRQSERQGAQGGMVDHTPHPTMPRGVSVQSATRCYRCGSPVEANGLCGGCLATQEDWERDEEDYIRQQDEIGRNEVEATQQEQVRLDQDNYYNDMQYDYNSHTDYYSNDY